MTKAFLNLIPNSTTRNFDEVITQKIIPMIDNANQDLYFHQTMNKSRCKIYNINWKIQLQENNANQIPNDWYGVGLRAGYLSCR
jgi:hypothetical protein